MYVLIRIYIYLQLRSFTCIHSCMCAWKEGSDRWVVLEPLCVCVCVCAYICIYMYTYICMHIYTIVDIHLCIFMCICTHTYIITSKYILVRGQPTERWNENMW